jgi:hypothetical protein
MTWWNRTTDLIPPFDKDEPSHVAQCREAAEYFAHEGYSMWHVVVITAWLVAENEHFFQKSVAKSPGQHWLNPSDQHFKPPGQ